MLRVCARITGEVADGSARRPPSVALAVRRPPSAVRRPLVMAAAVVA